MTRVLVVEDHEVVRDALAGLLRDTPDMEVVGVASSVRETLPLLAKTSPDILLADLSLGDGSATELVRALDVRGSRPGSSSSPAFPPFAAAEALAAGVSGYVLKSQSAEEMLEAIRAVALGRRICRRSSRRGSPAGWSGETTSGWAVPNRTMGQLRRARASIVYRGARWKSSVSSCRAAPARKWRCDCDQREDGGDPPDQHESQLAVRTAPTWFRSRSPMASRWRHERWPATRHPFQIVRRGGADGARVGPHQPFGIVAHRLTGVVAAMPGRPADLAGPCRAGCCSPDIVALAFSRGSHSALTCPRSPV